jgi:hypothetical protein
VFEVGLTEFLAGMALLVSAFAYFETKKVNRSQNRLTDREIELVRIQIQGAQNAQKQHQYLLG